mgnify:CR=1 FL=1
MRPAQLLTILDREFTSTREGHHTPVMLWGRDAEAIGRMRASRENARYLPGATLPIGLDPVADLDRALARAEEGEPVLMGYRIVRPSGAAANGDWVEFFTWWTGADTVWADFRRLGVLVRQGRGEPRAGSDGTAAGNFARSDPREFGRGDVRLLGRARGHRSRCLERPR